MIKTNDSGNHRCCFMYFWARYLPLMYFIQFCYEMQRVLLCRSFILKYFFIEKI